MTYVDGFVAAVPTKNKEKFIEFARIQADILKKAGALQIRECWGDDVPDGEVTSFPMAVKKKEDETVLFSWIVWPDKSVRDAGMKKVMEDPRMQPDGTPMLLDGKRIIFGGFEVVLEA